MAPRGDFPLHIMDALSSSSQCNCEASVDVFGAGLYRVSGLCRENPAVSLHTLGVDYTAKIQQSRSIRLEWIIPRKSSSLAPYAWRGLYRENPAVSLHTIGVDYTAKIQQSPSVRLEFDYTATAQEKKREFAACLYLHKFLIVHKVKVCIY